MIEKITHDSSIPVTAFPMQRDNKNADTMDDVIQQAYEARGITNAITKAAEDIKKRRLAIVTQIVKNHPQMGLFNSLQLKASKDNKIIWQGHDKFIPPTIKSDSELFFSLAVSQNKRAQEKFDTFFAKRMQLHYQNCTEEKEEVITRKCLIETMVTFGLFAKQGLSINAKEEPLLEPKWGRYL